MPDSDVYGGHRGSLGAGQTGSVNSQSSEELNDLDLEQVLARVRRVWSGRAAVVWMASPNAFLAGARPADVFQLQGSGPVLEALDAATWGGSA